MFNEKPPEDLNEARRCIHEAQGQLNYHLECFGDVLAKRQGYKDIDGMEAIWLYLIKTYSWTPAYVKSMNLEDIRFVLSQEMVGYTNPPNKGCVTVG
jgi:hypothetical protein